MSKFVVNLTNGKTIEGWKAGIIILTLGFVIPFCMGFLFCRLIS